VQLFGNNGVSSSRSTPAISSNMPAMTCLWRKNVSAWRDCCSR
jgi:hypothetical protein